MLTQFSLSRPKSSTGILSTFVCVVSKTPTDIYVYRVQLTDYRRGTAKATCFTFNEFRCDDRERWWCMPQKAKGDLQRNEARLLSIRYTGDCFIKRVWDGINIECFNLAVISECLFILYLYLSIPVNHVWPFSSAFITHHHTFNPDVLALSKCSPIISQ